MALTPLPAAPLPLQTQYCDTEFATLTKTNLIHHGLQLARRCRGQEAGKHAEPFGRAQQVLPHVWDPVSMFLASRVLLGPFMAPLMMAHACLP